MTKPFKVAVVVASRANYGRIKYVLKAIEKIPTLQLQLFITASCLLGRYGNAISVIKHDGFTPLATLYYVIEGGTLENQAKSTALGLIELSTAFTQHQPDLVITVADRFETMATAIAASYLNIPLLHVQGGEVSGNIDDRVRNAITMLSDYHCVATELSLKRILKMGAAQPRSFNTGCPSIDTLYHETLELNPSELNKYSGVGPAMDWSKPYILMVQHPVTTSYGESYQQLSNTLNALLQFSSVQKLVLWPNADAGSEDASKAIRIFRESNSTSNFHYVINYPPQLYSTVLANALCCVGNSSSFIREGSYLGVPAVIVGDRQSGREHCENVIFSSYNVSEIVASIQYQLDHGPYSCSNLFGDGFSGEKIASIINQIFNHVLD